MPLLAYVAGNVLLVLGGVTVYGIMAEARRMVEQGVALAETDTAKLVAIGAACYGVAYLLTKVER